MKKENEKRNRQIIEEYDYLGNAATSCDCTGLIPEGEVKEEELEAYQSLYRFGVPVIKKHP